MTASGRRRRTTAAIALTAGVTAGAALLSACGPDDSAAQDTTAPPATGTTTAPPAGSPAALNGTAHGGLTISDGSRYVVMNGTRVDFGTLVRDLAWSPDGRTAAFVDGDGDLAVSNPDGTGRRIVARNPGGQTWSHPTFQIRAADPANGMPALDNLIFVIAAGGTTRLYAVPATALGATPKPIGLNAIPAEDAKPLPQTGNTWPNGGPAGASVYANPGTGKVYIRDDNLRQQGSAIAPGAEPAMAQGSEEEIVFVRAVDGHDHLFAQERTGDGGTPRITDLTPHATTDYTEPAISPDGSQIAARTPGGIVTLPADGSAAPVRVSAYKGLPAYRNS